MKKLSTKQKKFLLCSGDFTDRFRESCNENDPPLAEADTAADTATDAAAATEAAASTDAAAATEAAAGDCPKPETEMT